MKTIMINSGHPTHHAALLFFAMCLALLVPCISLEAASDTFNVQTLVGDDMLPPSIPGSLAATPITTSQIHLSWDTSTDDYLLSGYHVWRDGVRIATTSSNEYDDVGLTAATTYQYYVTAYDSFFNESASSTVVSTSTLAEEVVVPTSSSTVSFGSRAVRMEDLITRLQVFPGEDNARVSFDTTEFTRAIIRWGRTSSYEMGSLAEQAHTRSHNTTISGLAPDTSYQFIIEGETNTGRSGTLHIGTFKTLPGEDVFPPGNVSGLNVVRKGDSLVLNWTNPHDSDFAKVRVVRNHEFYPSDIADGWVVYEGGGEGFIDTDALKDDTDAYYTVFSYDAKGNISSGSIIRYAALFEYTDVPLDPTLNEMHLERTDVVFTQDGEVYPLDTGRIYVDGSKEFTLTIPYEVLPEHLKTIIVVLRRVGTAGEKGETASFLLRINEAKTAYTATIAPLGVAGEFSLQLSVFDYKTMQIGYIDLAVTSIITSPYETPITSGGTRPLMSTYLVALVLLLTVTFLYQHEHKHL